MNVLTVSPERTRTDEDIVADIREDVLWRAMLLDRDAVGIRVRDGEVELAGLLEERSDAEVLTKLVQRVDGVASVKSNVRYRIDDVGRTYAGRFAGYRGS